MASRLPPPSEAFEKRLQQLREDAIEAYKRNPAEYIKRIQRNPADPATITADDMTPIRIPNDCVHMALAWDIKGGSGMRLIIDEPSMRKEKPGMSTVHGIAMLSTGNTPRQDLQTRVPHTGVAEFGLRYTDPAARLIGFNLGPTVEGPREINVRQMRDISPRVEMLFDLAYQRVSANAYQAGVDRGNARSDAAAARNLDHTQGPGSYGPYGGSLTGLPNNVQIGVETPPIIPNRAPTVPKVFDNRTERRTFRLDELNGRP
jgi:hypothetical protein